MTSRYFHFHFFFLHFVGCVFIIFMKMKSLIIHSNVRSLNDLQQQQLGMLLMAAPFCYKNKLIFALILSFLLAMALCDHRIYFFFLTILSSFSAVDLDFETYHSRTELVVFNIFLNVYFNIYVCKFLNHSYT